MKTFFIGAALAGASSERLSLFPISGRNTLHKTCELIGSVRLPIRALMAKKDKLPKPDLVRSSAAEYLTFVAASGSQEVSVQMRYEDENIWLTQKMMAQIYDVDVRTISEHLRNIFQSTELEELSVIRNFRITASDGKNYQVKHYNLQATIAVGFKVENERAVQFRKWANQIVKDYTIQGWVMDAERLKSGGSILTEEFFERQLGKVREIRLSERKFYQKITDIYATAIDYDSTAQATKRFFAAVQNKLHYAIHGQTAAELIVSRAEPPKGSHGADLLGRRAQWENSPIRRFRRQKLPVGLRTRANAAHCVGLPRYGRGAGSAPHPDDDGRLGGTTERLPALVGSRSAARCGKSDCRTRQSTCRNRVREIPHCARPAL